MADTQINAGGDSSASTVLMSVVIVLLIGLAIWFFGFRGGAAPAGDSGTNINVTVPADSGLPAGPAE